MGRGAQLLLVDLHVVAGLDDRCDLDPGERVGAVVPAEPANFLKLAAAAQGRRHFVYAALREGRFLPWDYQPLRDASRLYIRNDRELNDLEAMARFPPLR